MVTKTNVGKVGETHPHSSLRSKQRSLVKEPIMTISTHSLINTQVRKIDGLSIRYAESDARDVSAILLSPWPESLFTFEQMWSRLAEHAHLVAIDLPGFGHSERRNDLLTSSAMGESAPTSGRRRCCSPPRSILASCGASSSATARPLCPFRSALC